MTTERTHTRKAVLLPFCLLANCLTSLTCGFFLSRYDDPHDLDLRGKYDNSWASLVAYLVKTLPAMWETWVQSLVWENALEKGKATYSSILVWRIPWTV